MPEAIGGLSYIDIVDCGPQCYQERNNDRGLLRESHQIGYGAGVVLAWLEEQLNLFESQCADPLVSTDYSSSGEILTIGGCIKRPPSQACHSQPPCPHVPILVRELPLQFLVCTQSCHVEIIHYSPDPNDCSITLLM